MTDDTDLMVRTIMREIARFYYPRDVLQQLLSTVDLLRVEDGEDEQVFVTPRFDASMAHVEKIPSASRYHPFLMQVGEVTAQTEWMANGKPGIHVQFSEHLAGGWMVGDRVEVRKVG